jgi:hypothetical protein
MQFANKQKKDMEFSVENAITNLETGEKMEGRFFLYELTPHNIPETWKYVKVVLRDSATIRVI